GADVSLGTPAQLGDPTRPVVSDLPVGSSGALALLAALAVVVVGSALLAAYVARRARVRGTLGVRSVLPVSKLAVIGLCRRSVRVGAPQLTGTGVVRGRRSPGGVGLLVSYSPDGSPGRRSTRACPPGGSVIVGGLAFHHNPNGRPAGVP